MASFVGAGVGANAMAVRTDNLAFGYLLGEALGGAGFPEGGYVKMLGVVREVVEIHADDGERLLAVVARFGAGGVDDSFVLVITVMLGREPDCSAGIADWVELVPKMNKAGEQLVLSALNTAVVAVECQQFYV